MKMPLFDIYNNHYYSYNIGPVHFVSLDWDFFTLNPQDNIQTNMLNWLQNDLKNADSNRENGLPWLVVVNHRPLFCSSPGNADCLNNSQIYWQFDELFNQYHVDLFITGHVHIYER